MWNLVIVVLLWQPKEKGRALPRPFCERATLRVGFGGTFPYDDVPSLGLDDLFLAT